MTDSSNWYLERQLPCQALWIHTEISRVVVTGADQIHSGQVRHQTVDAALVHASAAGDDVEVVEHLQQPRARLVDGGHHGPPAARYLAEQRDALDAGRAVKSARGKDWLSQLSLDGSAAVPKREREREREREHKEQRAPAILLLSLLPLPLPSQLRMRREEEDA